MHNILNGIAVDNMYNTLNRIALANGSPGYWVTISAYINKKSIPQTKVNYPSQKVSGYLDTIGFQNLLWNVEQINHNKNHGINYSKLACLSDRVFTDKANEEICSCIKGFASEMEADGLMGLINVVGELHDNVWSHGESTGFSQAQKFNFRGQEIEFALADCGLGFLREVNRAGLRNVNSDAEAIEWCIEEGHSSKLLNAPDDWAQALPCDYQGNPMGKFGTVLQQNHHQGLGLAHLIKLVEKYDGTLHICSGESYLLVNNGLKSIHKSKSYWQGVAISCRFNFDNLINRSVNQSNEELADLIHKLTEGA